MHGIGLFTRLTMRQVGPASQERAISSSSVSSRTFEGWHYRADYVNPPHTPTVFDHTYVVCPSKGARWNCHGGSTGGALLAHSGGKGDYSKTKAMAGGASGNEEAGIQYGITGVCHQIANRLLVDTGISVLSANGARATSAFYGVYGTNLPGTFVEWQYRCRQAGITNPTPIGLSALNFLSYPDIVLKDIKKEKQGKSDQEIEITDDLLRDEQYLLLCLNTLYQQSDILPHKIQSLELELMLRHFFGSKISDEKIINMLRINAEFSEKNKIFPFSSLEKIEKSKIDIYETYGKEIQRRFEAFAQILGESSYGDYFQQIEPAHAKFAIHPDVFYGIALGRLQMDTEDSAESSSAYRPGT